jgi:hypothetical protein
LSIAAGNHKISYALPLESTGNFEAILLKAPGQPGAQILQCLCIVQEQIKRKDSKIVIIKIARKLHQDAKK